MGLMSMSKHEREAFLAEARVGVLAVSSGDGAGAPLVTPIWYSYEPGRDVVMTTDGESVKTAQLRTAGVASLCVQTETAPYKYVVVEGTVSVDDGVDSSWRRDLARHYLGGELGDMYADATAESEPTAVTVRLTPTRWRTTDFGKQWS
jgi:PPOX class probable F420-dependent enzyme